MTSPGGVFDPFNPSKADQFGKSSSKSSSSKPTPKAPKGYAEIHRGAQGSDDGTVGNGLLSTLKIPQGLNAWSEFTYEVTKPLPRGDNPDGDYQGPFTPGHNPNTANLTHMTMAGSMAYLRDLALHHNSEAEGWQYDAKVHELVAAGYLTPDKARYGTFTNDVANAFLRSAADVWSINNTDDDGQLVTWEDHIKALTDARIRSGQIDPKTGLPLSGAGGNGPKGPQRTDRYSNPETVRKDADAAAKDILGRKLNDKEFSAFFSAFHGKEKTYNDQMWAQQSSDATTTPSVTEAPTATADAEHYVDTNPGMSAERTESQLGSYLGVLRSMTGLGSGGVASGIG